MSTNLNIHSENAVVEGGLKMELLFEVTQAYFTFDQQYMGGKAPLLKLEGIDHDDGAEHTELWSIGSNWEPTENGDYVVPLKGQKGFNTNSVIGMVISRILNKSYGEHCFEELAGKSLRRGSTWKGTVWQLGAVEVDDVEKDEHGKPKKKLKRLPVEFVGRSKSSGGDWEYASGNSNAGSSQAVNSTPDQAALMAQLMAMQAAAAAPVVAPSAPAPVTAPTPAPAPAEDPMAAMQAQLAALQQQAAQAAQAAATPAPAPTPTQQAGPNLVHFRNLDQSKLKEFAIAANTSPDNNKFLVAAFGIDQNLSNGKPPEFTAALMSGALREELLFIAKGL
jgi:hypothetical protein